MLLFPFRLAECSRRSWLLLAAIVLLPGIATAAEPTAAKKTVTLIVDYGDGVQKRFTAIAWTKEMTVADALRIAQKHARGIRVQSRGSGATAFVVQIDNLKNEGRGRNWLYSVNGKSANRSYGAYKLAAADTILWKFGKYR